MQEKERENAKYIHFEREMRAKTAATLPVRDVIYGSENAARMRAATDIACHGRNPFRHRQREMIKRRQLMLPAEDVIIKKSRRIFAHIRKKQ